MHWGRRLWKGLGFFVALVVLAGCGSSGRSVADVEPLEIAFQDTADSQRNTDDTVVICQPQCNGKSCGEDGCGGLCGTCGDAEVCLSGACVGVADTCALLCSSFECGETDLPDGTHCYCGVCEGDLVCQGGACVVCAPSCTDRECGDDGCGGSCGECNEFPNSACGADGLCVCELSCEGQECGLDGCGGGCGGCLSGEACNEAGTCEADVTIIGCSDGSREGFIDPSVSPCWPLAGAPGTSRESTRKRRLAHESRETPAPIPTEPAATSRTFVPRGGMCAWDVPTWRIEPTPAATKS